MTEDQTIRAFVAVKLPASVEKFLEQVAEQLANKLPARAVRWVKPEAMHLTLRFLGDVSIEKMPALPPLLDQTAHQYPAFNLQLDKLGCFPSPQNPRVLWVGLFDPHRQLISLQQTLEQALIPHGWQPEGKPFQPHLTLGRVQTPSNQFSQLPWQKPLQPLNIPIKAIYLIKSQLRPTGPIYTTLHTSQLLTS